MSIAYWLLYRVGFKPWDNDEIPAALSDLVEGPHALPAGRVLDVGCGTGTHAVYLARAGWRVSALDVVEQPLREARRRAAISGVTVEWIRADVARLADVPLEPGFSLVHDRGCYHGLPDSTRTAYARAITALAAPGARLLVMAFARNRTLAGPSGADHREITTRFSPEWELVNAQPDSGSSPPGPMRNVPRTWYDLARR